MKTDVENSAVSLRKPCKPEDIRDLLTNVRTIAMVGITPLNNVSGGPAISVPCGFDGAGLPLGAQFAGPAGTEAALLELAYEVEELRPFARIDG